MESLIGHLYRVTPRAGGRIHLIVADAPAKYATHLNGVTACGVLVDPCCSTVEPCGDAGLDYRGEWLTCQKCRAALENMQENPYPLPPPERIVMIPNPRRKKQKLELPLGEYERLRVRLGLVRDPDWDGPTEPIGSAKDVYNAVRLMGVEPVEAMYVVLLDNRNCIIGLHEAARGGGRSIAIEPGTLLQAAVLTGARSVILVHNHPSGLPAPSPEDEQMTSLMEAACKILGIRLLDHLIVGADSYVSFADLGIMP